MLSHVASHKSRDHTAFFHKGIVELTFPTRSHSLTAELDIHPRFLNIKFLSCSKRYISKLPQTSNFKLFLMLLLLSMVPFSLRVQFRHSFWMVKVRVNVWDRVKTKQNNQCPQLGLNMPPSDPESSISPICHLCPQYPKKTQVYLIVIALTVVPRSRIWRHFPTSSGHG